MHLLLSGRLAICHAESHRPQPTKHKYMLLAEKKMEEIERKNARLGTLPGESPVECHSVRLPPSLKLLSGVFDMLGTPGNKKGS